MYIVVTNNKGDTYAQAIVPWREKDVEKYAAHLRAKPDITAVKVIGG